MTSPTERGTRDAFLSLVALAHADRVTGEPEAAALERFQRHLGIPDAKARRYRRLARRLPAAIPPDERGRLDLLAMMVHVAWSDGRLCDAERAFLREVAERFAVSGTSFARVLHDGEERARLHLAHRRQALIAGAALVLVVAAGVGFALHPGPVGGDDAAVFREVEARAAPSIVLLHVAYELAHPDGRRLSASSTGTGFFVAEDGLVATNKHVVEPWKFAGEVSARLAEGFVVQPASRVVRAWSAGARFRRADGSLDDSTGWSTARRTLEVVAVARDVLRPRDGLATPVHASDNHDLALLRCRVSRPAPALELAGSTASVRKLDPVMVIGYPRGTHLLEGLVAECSPVIGHVRKAEDSIYITAPIVPGNSGGPLLDARGRVIGVATRIGGDSTVGCCIRADHVRRLIR